MYTRVEACVAAYVNIHVDNISTVSSLTSFNLCVDWSLSLLFAKKDN